MNIVIWVLIGLVAGRLAQVLFNDSWHTATAGNLVAGVLGAMTGGFVMGMTGLAGATGFSIWVPLAALVGAAAFLAAGRVFTSTPT
jgi:uncharacterized membrane protein YeaQ/YmgE (transglycosylase-associated protein family)